MQSLERSGPAALVRAVGAGGRFERLATTDAKHGTQRRPTKMRTLTFAETALKADTDRVDGKIGSRLRGGLANVLPPFYQDRRGGSTFARPGAARRASSHSSRVKRRVARASHTRETVAHSSRRDQGGRGGRAAASTVVVRPTTAVAVGSKIHPKIGSPRFSGRDYPPWAPTVMLSLIHI